ncbi:pimeloyl-ACP methyl ester carboxylesterase [Kribbella steppae]|uniref:Pimeloyl-ACP methyl ester carboxylesterase n=1 Tax=Kribbella steppae TaxID=2512223 RepID=A0A4R2H373_9ACTN|nr:alpha/beta hydrolase [Kribbella steppae]TCO19679.1 pimeloyl-ACP methyl ester carboxylesterase [Kribbella steppae]
MSTATRSSRLAHLISVRALAIVIAAVAAIAGLLIAAEPGASAQTGSAHARSAPGSPALTAQRACSLNPSPPAGFVERKVKVNGIGINYVRGGHGPTLLLLHGYPQTWYTWDHVLPALAQRYTVVAPDLPGAGLSDAPASSAAYTKKAMAADIYALMVKLGLSRNIRIVGHDIGTTVAYPYAAAHRDDVVKLVLSEAPIPDPVIYTFPSLTPNGPGLWWFGLFAEKNGLAEDLMSGRERQWVTDFMPTSEVVKGAVTACDMDIYAHFLAQPGHLRASIEWFATLPQDVKDNAIYQKTKLSMPVLAIGASGNLGTREATWVREYAANVTGLVIPSSGHWLYQEHPAELTSVLLQFLR